MRQAHKAASHDTQTIAGLPTNGGSSARGAIQSSMCQHAPAAPACGSLPQNGYPPIPRFLCHMVVVAIGANGFMAHWFHGGDYP